MRAWSGNGALVGSSDRAATNNGPSLLEGVKVLSLGAFVAGNVCPMILAELGADVVKVESRRRPEALRVYHSPDHGRVMEPSGTQTTAMFSVLTRSMSNISIDVDKPDGAATLRSLAATADILIENLGPGVMDKWGCSYPALADANERLVVVSISGYGRTGPRSSYRAYASSITNYLGLAAIWNHDGSHFDFVAAYHGAYAALGAWTRARATGQGAFLDVSQMEAGAAVMAPVYLDSLVNGVPWTYGPNEIPGSLLSSVVRCAGADAWAAVELEDLDDWHRLCQVLESADLDVTAAGDAKVLAEAMTEALSAWASRLTPMQVSLKLQAAGLAAAPVQNGEDLWRDPQLRSRGAFVEVPHPDLGTIEQPQSPDYMSATPGRLIHRGRRLGEDTADVLGRWLHLNAGDIAALHESGAVFQTP